MPGGRNGRLELYTVCLPLALLLLNDSPRLMSNSVINAHSGNGKPTRHRGAPQLVDGSHCQISKEQGTLKVCDQSGSSLRPG